MLHNLNALLRSLFCLIPIIILFPPSISAASVKTKVKDIEYQSFKDYTRVTIYLSGSAELTITQLSDPERIFFHLENTVIPKNIEARLNKEENLSRLAMIGQFDDDTVTIMLELQKIKDFKKSFLNNPPRFVIDIYTEKPSKEESPVETLPAPAKKPEITPMPLTKEPEAVAPASTKPGTVSPSPPQSPEVTAPALKKEPDVVPPEQKPEGSPMLKEDAADYISSGEKHIQSGEDGKALLDFRKAAELSPQSAETYVAIGRSLFKLGKKDEALEVYKKAIERDPNSADAYNGLGYSYYLQGKLGSAVDAFLVAIKLNPEHDDAHAGLGYTYLTMGDTNSAIERYRILKSLDSNKADELFRLIFKEQKTKEQTKTLK